jgi:hypothetical protein
VNAAQQWKFEEGAAQERVATLKFSFVILPPSSKVPGQTIFLPPGGVEIRQKPAEPAKPAGHFQDFSDFAACFGWILGAQTTRCSGRQLVVM